MPILRFRPLRLYLQFRSGIFLARFSAGQRVTVGITHSRTPLIGMAAAGRTGALIFERPGLDRVFTLLVRTSAAVIEPRRIIVGQREANLGGAFGHILQFKNRVRNTIRIPRRATRNVAPIEGEGKIFRVRTRRKRCRAGDE